MAIALEFQTVVAMRVWVCPGVGAGREFGDIGRSVFGRAVSWSVGLLLEASQRWQQFKGVINHEVHCVVICLSSRMTNLSSLSRISSMIARKMLHPRNPSVFCKPGQLVILLSRQMEISMSRTLRSVIHSIS